MNKINLENIGELGGELTLKDTVGFGTGGTGFLIGNVSGSDILVWLSLFLVAMNIVWMGFKFYDRHRIKNPKKHVCKCGGGNCDGIKKKK